MVPSLPTSRAFRAYADGPLASMPLRDVSAESGIDFRFHDGSRGRHDLPEIMGGGLALIDVDGDGLLDLFFANGGPILTGPGHQDPPCRAYRNLGGLRFRDVTAEVHAPGPSYAMGCAVGDYDGDGRDDLFVTGWRDQRLYRNLGGRFEDVTAAAGLSSDLWSTSAAFADLDGDGDLDLYVCNYVDYDPMNAPFHAAPDGRRDYGAPEDFPAQPDRLYRNDGGRFTDVSGRLVARQGRGLGVLIADLTGDHRSDVFVANDGGPCRLFANRGAWRFEEVGEAAGVALDGQGRALAAMGVAHGDIDGDGRGDLVVGNLFGRSTVVFQSLGRGLFRDASTELGLTAATRDVTGFGLVLSDLNGDGRPDLVQANGHVLDRARLGVPLAMRPIIMEHDGRKLVEARGPWGDRVRLGRGLAVGDLDNDGRPDLVLAALDAPPLVLRDEAPGRWVTIELLGPSAVGARVWAASAGRSVVRDVVGGGSYLTASDRRLFFPVGDAPALERVTVRWPSGRVESWDNVAGPTRWREGSGRTDVAPH